MSDRMFALVPVAIATAALISSSVEEPDPAKVMPDGVVGETLWVSGVTYAENVRVIRTTTHRRYRRTAVAGAATLVPEDSPLQWIDEGPSNRWAWADAQAVTRTVGDSPYTLTVRPGVCTSIELYGLQNVNEVSVSMLDEPGGTEVFSLESTADEYASTDPHWSFYFEGPLQGESFSVTDMPVYPGCEITITLSSYDGEQIQAGLIAFGSFEDLGFPAMDFETIYRDYSAESIDQWGNAIDTPGAQGKDLRGTVYLPIAEANGVSSTLRRLLGRGAIYVPSLNPEHRFLKTWGKLKPGRIQADGGAAILQIEIEGRI